MKLNSILRALSVSAALASTSLFANSVVITHDFPAVDGGGGGGEFLATTSDNGSFLTFCMEHDVSISLGATYSYTIDATILKQNDPISKGSAYLYNHFLDGTLSGPNGSGTYAGGSYSEHKVDAGLLQKALWILEGEIPAEANYYVSLVSGIYANPFANAGNTNVKALNIWTVTTVQGRDGLITKLGDKQSMLIRVPDAGMTIALFGLGLLSLAAFRRKL